MNFFTFLVAIFFSLQVHAAGPVCGPLVNPTTSSEDCPSSGLDAWTPPLEAQWTRDVDGQRSGIMNVYVHGDLDQLREALKSAGWIQSVDNNRKDDVQYLHAVFTYEHAILTEKDKKLSATYRKRLQSELNKAFTSVQSMPVSNEYYCGDLQTIAFEKNNNPLGGRHHLRIWVLGQKDNAGVPVLAVAASHDIGIVFDRSRPKQGFLNHKVESDADLERDLVVIDLKKSGAVAAEKQWAIKFSCPAPRDGLTSADQRAVDLTLKN